MCLHSIYNIFKRQSGAERYGENRWTLEMTRIAMRYVTLLDRDRPFRVKGRCTLTKDKDHILTHESTTEEPFANRSKKSIA